MSQIIVDKNNLNSYKLKLTAISPIHIGTGEVYEPTNYVIDDNILYGFNEVFFYKSLSPLDKKSFDGKLSDYMQIIDFYKRHKQNAIDIAHFQCEVSSEIQNAYNKQLNKDGTKNKNQLEIQTTFKNPNTHRAIIPGSSIKGMLDTALQIYPKKIKENDIRQNLLVSDAIFLDGGVEIGRADRRHKNPSKKSKGGIYQRIEVIKPQSEFMFSIDSKFTFEDIKQALNRFHSQRKNSRYKETQNSFVARVGKNEGKDYMVDDGRNVTNTKGKPVATHFLYNSNTLKDEQFGWIKIDLITEDAYKNSLKEIQKQEKKYFDDLTQKQHALKESIQKAQEKEKALKLKKQQEKEAEEKAKLEAEQQEKERLTTLSPYKLRIEELQKEEPNTPLDTIIFNALTKTELDDFKSEALEDLKQLMLQENKWIEVSKKKNPAKDKNYKRTLKIKEMLGE